MSVAHGITSSGGDAQSASFSLGSGLAQPSTGTESSSPSFQLRSGVAWAPAAVASSDPVVFGVRANAGAASGGDLVSVFGFNFTAPGAGTNNVEIAGNAGAGTLTVSNLELQTVTPQGVNGFGNPLGLTSVAVDNALGSHAADRAFFYRPALQLVDPSQVGRPIRVRMLGAPDAIAFLMLGGSIPATAIPIPPLAGALEALVGLEFLTPPLSLPDGQLVLSTGTLKNPALAGVTIELQSLVFDDVTFATGSFSNLLPITVQS